VSPHGPTHDHGRESAGAFDLVDAKADEAVVDQDLVARVEDTEQCGGHDRQVAVRRMPFPGDRHPVPFDEHPGSLEVADPNLRALEVCDEGERTPGALLRLPHETRALAVLLMGAVGEVEPRRVHARRHEPVDHLDARGGRPDRAHDLRTAEAVAHDITLARADRSPPRNSWAPPGAGRGPPSAASLTAKSAPVAHGMSQECESREER
jgi:hypothetical protein